MKPIGCAGQARRSSRCMAQSLRSRVSPKARVVQEGPPRRPVETTRVLIAVRGPAPTASGANSAASALGSLARRDPGETVRTYHEGFQEDLKIGTFYFGGIRNFLLWSDRGVTERVSFQEDREARESSGSMPRVCASCKPFVGIKS